MPDIPPYPAPTAQFAPHPSQVYLPLSTPSHLATAHSNNLIRKNQRLFSIFQNLNEHKDS